LSNLKYSSLSLPNVVHFAIKNLNFWISIITATKTVPIFEPAGELFLYFAAFVAFWWCYYNWSAFIRRKSPTLLCSLNKLTTSLISCNSDGEKTCCNIFIVVTGYIFWWNFGFVRKEGQHKWGVAWSRG
jgi:hypothetical protein